MAAATSPIRAFSLQADVLQLQGEVQNVSDGLQQTRTEAEQIRSEVEQLTAQLRTVFADLGEVTRQQLSDRTQFEDLTALQVVKIRDEVVQVKEDLKTTTIEAKKEFENNRKTMHDLAYKIREELQGMVDMAKSAEAQVVRDETDVLQRDLRQLHADAAAGWQQHENKLTDMRAEVEQAFGDVKRKISTMESNESRGGGGAGQEWHGQGDRLQKGYLPMKTLIPDKLTDKAEDWRRCS